MSPGLRRTSAVVAITALAIGGAKVASDYTMPGSGFSTVQTAAADPTGPGGPTGGPGMDGGQQFQPPQMPSSMPDYQGGNNQPPLNQDNGVSIYNSGNPQAPQQVPGQQGGQSPQQAQQPAHGTQMPDYQSNPGYTQGPGQPNPNYQAPQQNSPQQPQQGQQQPQQQQPENKQDDTTQQLNQEKQQKCMNAAVNLDYVSLGSGGGGSLDMLPEDPLTPLVPCNGACSQLSQPGGRHSIQKDKPLPKADDPKAQAQIDHWKKVFEDQAKKCGATDIVGDIAQINTGVYGVILSLPAIPAFGAGFVTGLGAAWVAIDGVSKIADCTRNSGGIHPIAPGK